MEQAAASAISPVALRRLDYLNSAVSLSDVRAPPGNRWEALQGSRQGQHSIRINDQWRICFVWTAAGRLTLRSWIITEIRNGETDMPRIHTHPGEILREDFMAPLGLSATALAASLGVPTNRLTAVIAGERSVTPNTALRLARYFNTSPEVWLNLQAAHDLSREISEHGAEISDRVKPREAA